MKKETTIFSLLIGVLALIVIAGCSLEHDDHEHEHSVEIEGKEMRLLTVQEVAELWEIDSEVLLSRIITELDLKESYTVDSILEDMREEYAFSPALIKDMAEEIKQQNLHNE